MEDYEEASAVNSELRFLTIELMKLAARQRVPFDEVLDEYFENAYKLKRRLLVAGSAPQRRLRHARKA